MFSKALTMGGTGLGLARQMLASMGDQALRRTTVPERNGKAVGLETKETVRVVEVVEEDGQR